MTRKEFLEQVMKMANLRDLKQADEATRAVISLTKLIIGPKLSQKIAEVSPPDLRIGWEAIQPAYPKKSIKIITGPGGEDEDIRQMVPYLQKYLGVEVVIEHIVGFWGRIPFEKFQTTDPDGYTLMCYTFPRSIMIELTGESHFKTREFTPIFAWSSGNQFLVVPSERFKTFDEFIKEAKTRRFSAAIPVKRGISHLSGLLFSEGLGIQVDWIPYGGLASSMAALNRGEVDFMISLANALPTYMKTGRIKVLAMLPEKSGKRCPYFQHIPSLKELGYDISMITVRHVLEAPPNTPAHIVMVLEGALKRAIQGPTYLEWAKRNFVNIEPLDVRAFSQEKEEAYTKIERVKEKFGEE